jgi:phospholipid/cholesterol/gamma-HCH transport system substrate-binding protein
MQSTSGKITLTFVIGLFVIVGSGILITALIWLGTSKVSKENVIYSTFFDGSVEGLEAGSPVKYLGVPAGTITKIDLAKDGKLIKILMQLDPRVKMVDSLRVKSELAGLAGRRFLQLYFPTSPDMLAMHPDLSFTPEYPVIPSSPSGFEEISIAAQKVLSNLEKLEFERISNSMVTLLESSSYFFSNEDLYETIHNLKNASDKVTDIMVKADSSGIIDNLMETSKDMAIATEELKRFSETLHEQYSDINLDDRVDNSFNLFDSTLILSQKTISSLGYRSESILFSINETLQDLKKTNKQLRKSLEVLNENPSQVLFSKPPKKKD